MNIRLVALDLDGTTMNSDNRLSDYNRKTLEAAVQAGIQVVVASGRAFDALPKEVLAIPGHRSGSERTPDGGSLLPREALYFRSPLRGHSGKRQRLP